MEENVEAASKAVDLTEKGLLTSIALKEPTYTGLEYQLAQFRDACSNFIFLNWHSAALRDVETRLWNAHGRVNSKFRPYLARFREGDGKKKHVERRKAEKLYLDFIKSSMRFYRGFIQRLASHFKDVPEVFEIARRFSLDTLSADSPVSVDLALKCKIVQSCHATLIHLGDLSRYRETELNLKERNWGPAKGYYDLASALDPADGQSFNQLAVIALADGDHLRAVYYLYRALSTQKPPPLTLGNLEVEFKKILKYHKRGASLLPSESSTISNELLSSFLAYHATCYSDPGFPNHQNQREALVAGLAAALKTQLFDSSYRKMCIINIAAGKHAEARASDLAETNTTEALQFLTHVVKNTQALNIATCSVLFSILTEELRETQQNPEPISSVTRRILPLLRLYTGWLLSSAEFLLQAQHSMQLHEALHDLWVVYAEALSLLIELFPLREFVDVPYLLDEDQDTLAFTPFSDAVKKLHFHGPAGLLKPNRSDSGLPEARTPEEEMRFRIKDLVKVGLHLTKHRNDFGGVAVPLLFAGKRFHFVDENSSPAYFQDSELPSRMQDANDLHSELRTRQTIIAEANPVGRSPPTLENMVNELVGPEPRSPQSMATSQAQSPGVKASVRQENSRPSSSTFTAQDLVRQMQHPLPTAPYGANDQPAHHTSLPGIFPTAFTPRPGEGLTSGSGSGSRPSTAHQVVPPGTVPLPRSTAALEFEHQIAQMQHNIQTRTSPITAFEPTQSSSAFYETPTGLQTFIRNQSDPSRWESSIPTPSAPATEIPRKTPQASPFGAIGEARPRSAHTPPSGQPG